MPNAVPSRKRSSTAENIDKVCAMKEIDELDPYDLHRIVHQEVRDDAEVTRHQILRLRRSKGQGVGWGRSVAVSLPPDLTVNFGV